MVLYQNYISLGTMKLYEYSWIFSISLSNRIKKKKIDYQVKNQLHKGVHFSRPISKTRGDPHTPKSVKFMCYYPPRARKFPKYQPECIETWITPISEEINHSALKKFKDERSSSWGSGTASPWILYGRLHVRSDQNILESLFGGTSRDYIGGGERE